MSFFDVFVGKVVVVVIVVVVLAVVFIGIVVIVVGVSVMCCRHSCFNYRRRCGDLSFFWCTCRKDHRCDVVGDFAVVAVGIYHHLCQRFMHHYCHHICFN